MLIAVISAYYNTNKFTMLSQVVNGAEYWLPENENDVMVLVNQAKAEGKTICLRGAAHSFPLIGKLENESTTGNNLYVMLSKMYDVKINASDSTVWVQAGCHLGPDPWDPTGISTLQNSLLYQLDQAGLALGDLGGITHQTVGGFLSTGSSGGSTQFSFDEALLSIDIISCGVSGAVKTTFTKPVPDNPNDPFYGAGVATMGLMGIIVSATFKCIPRFYIMGQEATTTVDNCEIDLFGDGVGGKPSLQAFFQQQQTQVNPGLTQTPYSRMIWWPQENVKKMVVWKAAYTDKAGADAWAAQAYVKTGQKNPPELKPYQEVPYIMGSAVPATLGADILFTAIGQWPTWLEDLIGKDKAGIIEAVVNPLFYPVIFPRVLDVFVAVDTPTNANKGPQQFSDIWYTGLPMDNQMSDKLMPVWFTELWIDINQSKAVMNDLLNFYNAGTQNTMAFSCEIYAAKKSTFWLSPAYNTDVIRIDVFWFANTSGDPFAFYQKFWALLAKYNFRPHWGKYLPDGAGPQGVSYLQNCYKDHWNDWMALREKMDPNQIFVNDYWRGHLGIAPVAK